MTNLAFKPLENIGVSFNINEPLPTETIEKHLLWANSRKKFFSTIYKSYALIMAILVILFFAELKYASTALAILFISLIPLSIIFPRNNNNHNEVYRLLKELDIELDHEAIINLKDWSKNYDDISKYLCTIIAMGRKPTVFEYLSIKRIAKEKDFYAIAKIKD